MIETWRATCMQVYTRILNRASAREEAMEIVNNSLDRWSELAGASRQRDRNQLLLFPEFALQGFPIHESADEWIAKACFQIPGPETDRLQKLAQDLKCYIGANSYEIDPEWPGRYFNCSYLIEPSGDMILKYRRINTAHSASPHDFLDKYLDRYGLEGMFPVVKTPLGNIGMMPCGEIMYPEPARALAFMGAEVILHPTSDYGADDNWSWQSAKKVRASENMVYLISANAGGMPEAYRGVHDIAGQSRIFDWEGRVLAQGPTPGESLRCSTLINVEALREVRSNGAGFNRIAQARPDAYAKLYADTTIYPVNRFADKPMESKKMVREVMGESLDNMAKRDMIPPRKK
ncbi:MAG: nitrilase-related carbon-nitrogen hydrolase [Rhodospirillaceae bacterium]|nr:nitrilase-related carbon-nitrogen hydrolase [Rhodospirillaceae bacterium]